MALIEALVFLVLPLALEDIPDYDSPYVPIFTDKPVYSWTDKVKMRIAAPSWNSDRHLIDTIGGTDQHWIKVSTREHTLKPYRFAETSENSGIFAAEVILTGFPHDVNGDGRYDTVPRTTGSGPANGFLETDRDSALTISFEFADGVVLVESVPIRWNLGEVLFSQDSYAMDDTATVRVMDPDMNLNPEALDRVGVLLSSDSDIVGIELDAIETSESSGVFVGSLGFTGDQPSSGTRLHAMPHDTIYAVYDDHTLPKPHSKSDVLEARAAASLADAVPAHSVRQTGIIFTDESGSELDVIQSGRQVQIVGILSNDEFRQPFAYIFQVRDESGSVMMLSWVAASAMTQQDMRMSQSWMPERPGTYVVDTFVWSSLDGMSALAPSLSVPVLVE